MCLIYKFAFYVRHLTTESITINQHSFVRLVGGWRWRLKPSDRILIYKDPLRGNSYVRRC